MSLESCIVQALAKRFITRDQANRFRERLSQVQDEAAARQELEKFINGAAEARRVNELKVIAFDNASRNAASHPDGMGAGVEALLARDPTERAGFSNVDFRAKAIYDKARAKAVDAYEKMAVRHFGLVVDDGLMDRVGAALFGQASDDEAAALARQLAAAQEMLRQRGNVAGKLVSKRKDFALPQVHDLRRIGKTDMEEWVNYTAERLKQIWTDDGAINAQLDMKNYLASVHQQAVDGALRLDSGGHVGNVQLESESRRLIFKDYQAWKEYSERFGYGEKNLLNAIDENLRNSSREQALLEILGPRPKDTLDALVETAANKGQLSAWQRGRIERLWNVVSGDADRIQTQWLANAGSFIRSNIVASMFGSAQLSALSDVVTAAAARQANGMALTRAFDEAIRGMSRAEAARLGIAADSTLLALQRSKFGEMSGAAGLSGKLADFVLRASGVTEWTEAGRSAFGKEWLAHMGELVHGKTRFENLDPVMQRQLGKYGINEGLWDNVAIRGKTLTKDGAHFLDLDSYSELTRDLVKKNPFREAAETIEAAESIRTGRQPKAAVRKRLEEQHREALKLQSKIQTLRDVENKLREFMATETEFAMISGNDARVRAINTWGAQRGTLIGEGMRTLTLAKSFPLSAMFYHLARGLNAQSIGGKAGYLASFVAASTIVGAISLQAREVVKGRDPRDMRDPGFWRDAAATGGGLAIFDQLLEAGSGFDRMVMQLAGPAVGAARDVFNLTAGNVMKAAQGKETNVGRDVARFAEKYTPGSNVWYSRLVLQRLWWNNLMRLLDSNPEEYFWRQQQAAQSWNAGQEYWWRPGQLAPERPPDVSAISFPPLIKRRRTCFFSARGLSLIAVS